MNLITTLEENIKKTHQKNWDTFLYAQKVLVEQNFDWLKLKLDPVGKALLGKGRLNIGGKSYEILLSFSPFYQHRYDRIVLKDSSILYHKDIHVYGDMTLCLYHPIIDQSLFKKLPLYKMIPWISEWIVFYEQWKKYGVWLGNEIKH